MGKAAIVLQDIIVGDQFGTIFAKSFNQNLFGDRKQVGQVRVVNLVQAGTMEFRDNQLRE